MKSPTLLLEEYYLTRLQLDHNFPSSTPTITIASVNSTFDYEVMNHRDDARRRMLKLKVQFQEQDEKQQKVGYHIDCEIVGFFAFTESTPQGKEEAVLRINGFNLLYGALRGLLATTTAVFPAGRFTVPNVMPNEIVADIERRREAAKPPPAIPASTPAA